MVSDSRERPAQITEDIWPVQLDGCKVTYIYSVDDCFNENDYEKHRCSACHAVYLGMDEEPEDDDYTDLDYENDCRINRGQ